MKAVTNAGGTRSRSYGIWLAAAAGLACVWAYWPGLGGPFVFDDFGTIAALGDLGSVDNWHAFKTFVLGGHAGPTGRPVALLTFLLDGNTWPTDPWPFKRTNLIIHLLTGAALALVASQILKILGYDRRHALLAATLTAAFWLLHPYLVSTTLYAVQRMAQLPALFALLGIAGYLHGRVSIGVNDRKAYLIMSASIAVSTVLATLSKENGILVPVLVAVVEITVLRTSARYDSLNRYWATTVLAIPTAAIVTYLAWASVRYGFFTVAGGRDYSVYERLLTQSRVLVDYLQHWFVPELYTSGVFQDHVVKSTGLLTPFTTLLSAAFHVAVVTTAIVVRRRLPLVALAILFFYAGHLLESTVLNLEMYFEHRNYLPAMFLVLPIFALAVERLSMPVLASASVVILVALCVFTRYSATVWSNYDSMVEAAARKAPTSARAQQQFAVNQFNAGRTDAALTIIDRALEQRPGDHSLLLTRVILHCQVGTMNRAAFRPFADAAVAARYAGRMLDSYSLLLATIANGGCGDVGLGDARDLFTRLLDDPSHAKPSSLGYSHLQFFLGYIAAAEGDPARAVEHFNASLASRPGAGHAMYMASVLATMAYFDEALVLSEIALQQLDLGARGFNQTSHVRESDILSFQEQVRREMRAPNGGGP